MERMINARLVWFLEPNGLLSTIQCGFRQGRSTLDHLVRFETFIRNAFAKKQHAVSIFFDLEKAYDTTWKYGILKDLFDMGLKGKLPREPSMLSFKILARLFIVILNNVTERMLPWGTPISCS
jgi:hypothetical protein